MSRKGAEERSAGVKQATGDVLRRKREQGIYSGEKGKKGYT